jgi:hypothetical protein
VRTVATASDLNQCPRCGAPGLHHPSGVGRRTQQAYAEFWSCNNLGIPCRDDRPTTADRRNFTLTWKSPKQWAFLHDTITLTSTPS